MFLMSFILMGRGWSSMVVLKCLFSIGICSWWLIVLHLLLIVVGGDWLFHLLGEGGVEGQAFLSGDVREDVEGGWFPFWQNWSGFGETQERTKMNL